MKKIVFLLIVQSVVLLAAGQDYKNARLPVQQRVNDLLQRMTTEEKFWQLFMLVEDWSMDKSRYTCGAFGFEGGVSAQDGSTAGQMIQITGSDNAAAMTRAINAAQKHFIENTRLGIPMLPFDEALH